MKTLLRFSASWLTALVVLALCTLTATAQQYSPVTLISGTTIAATATSNYTHDVVLTKASDVAFQLSFQGNGAGTDAVTVTFKESIDGTTWSTTPTKTWVVAANGNTAVALVTNFTVNAVGYIRLASIAVASADRAMTNLTVKSVIKPALLP
jgi:hypothetical protein